MFRAIPAIDQTSPARHGGTVRLPRWLTADPTQRLLRNEPVLAVPPNITLVHVERCVLRWSPGAAREADGSLALTEFVLLRGPFSYDAELWRDAELPAALPSVYVASHRPHPPQHELLGHDLIVGLCRRLGGQCRHRVGSGWLDIRGLPAEPRVYAPRELLPQEVLRLLASHLPGLELAGRAKRRYELSAPDAAVVARRPPASLFPLVRREHWYSSPEATAEYSILPDEDPQPHERAAQAAQALADATGGLLLDEDGFPWEGPHRDR
jgi:hypothetical protein